MAKEGQLMQFLKGLEIDKVVELPNASHDNLMNATQYRARRKYGIFIEKVEDCDYRRGSFKIKRVLWKP